MKIQFINMSYIVIAWIMRFLFITYMDNRFLLDNELHRKNPVC